MDDANDGYARLAAAAGSNAAGALNGAGASDFVGLAMKLVPRLLESAEDRKAIASQQNEGLLAMRKHLLMLRRELRELAQSHTEALEELRRMRHVQASMVAHLARVQIMESPRDEEELGDADLNEFAPMQQPRRGNARRRTRDE